LLFAGVKSLWPQLVRAKFVQWLWAPLTCF